jgi:hypothetical protein
MIHTSPFEDVIAVLTATPRFRTLTRILVASLVLDDLRTPGPWLLLAPPDEAFEELPPDLLPSLFRRADVESLVDLAENHVARAPLPRAGGALRSLLGEPVVVHPSGRLARGGRIVRWQPFDHGVLGVVDRVLWPPLSSAAARVDAPCEVRLQ